MFLFKYILSREYKIHINVSYVFRKCNIGMCRQTFSYLYPEALLFIQVQVNCSPKGQRQLNSCYQRKSWVTLSSMRAAHSFAFFLFLYNCGTKVSTNDSLLRPSFLYMKRAVWYLFARPCRSSSTSETLTGLGYLRQLSHQPRPWHNSHAYAWVRRVKTHLQHSLVQHLQMGM